MAAGLVLAATLIVPTPTARAHATLDRSSPPDGATVDRAPDEVWAEFTEPLAPSSTMRITDHCGRVSDDGEVQIEVTRMTLGMTATTPSLYTVTWRTTSMVDGHSAEGYWTFTVAGTQAPCTGVGPPTTQPPEPRPLPSAQGGGSGVAAPSAPTTVAPTPTTLHGADAHDSTDDDDHDTAAPPTAAPPTAAGGGVHGAHAAHGNASSGVALPEPVDQGSSAWLRVGVPGVLIGGLGPLVAARRRPRLV